MKYNPRRHNRRSMRLKGYDYSRTGLYFITICCHQQKCLFGDVIDGEMRLNAAGIIAKDCWLSIPDHFPNVVLHQFVVMPNHIHGIIEFTVGAKNFSPQSVHHQLPQSVHRQSPQFTNQKRTKNNVDAKNVWPKFVGAKNFSPLQERLERHSRQVSGTSKTIGSVVRGFKIGVTNWMRNNTDIYCVWQRNYYEHIIRNKKSHQTISNYIRNNPENWRGDRFYKN